MVAWYPDAVHPFSSMHCAQQSSAEVAFAVHLVPYLLWPEFPIFVIPLPFDKIGPIMLLVAHAAYTFFVLEVSTVTVVVSRTICFCVAVETTVFVM